MGSRGGTPVATRWRWLNWPGWARVGIAAGYFAVLNWMLLAPSDSFEDIQLFPYQDKVEHVLAFLFLAWIARWAAPARLGAGARTPAVIAALAAFAFGIEWLQPMLTGGDRQREWLDLASNCLGIAAGWLLFGVAAAGAAVSATRGGSRR